MSEVWLQGRVLLYGRSRLSQQQCGVNNIGGTMILRWNHFLRVECLVMLVGWLFFILGSCSINMGDFWFFRRSYTCSRYGLATSSDGVFSVLVVFLVWFLSAFWCSDQVRFLFTLYQSRIVRWSICVCFGPMVSYICRLDFLHWEHILSWCLHWLRILWQNGIVELCVCCLWLTCCSWLYRLRGCRLPVRATSGSEDGVPTSE